MPAAYSSLLSPLGMMGFDYTGAYSSYPTMNSMGYGGMYGMNDMMYGGAMGMYSPMMMGMGGSANGTNPMNYYKNYMEQMNQTRHDIEKSEVEHSQDMHEALNQAEVNSRDAHNRAIFQKLISDGEIQCGIRNLVDVIRKGDSDAACQEYEKLRANIYTKFATELKSDPTRNIKLDVDNYINNMYSQIVQQQGGVPADIKEDMKQYGESAFMNGFRRTFLGNKGHNKKYTEEAIAYIDGTRVNDKDRRERERRIGGYLGRGVEGAGAWAAGGVAGVTTLGLGKLFCKSVPGLSRVAAKSWGKAGTWGKIGALAVLGADILWQMSRD